MKMNERLSCVMIIVLEIVVLKDMMEWVYEIFSMVDFYYLLVLKFDGILLGLISKIDYY